MMNPRNITMAAGHSSSDPSQKPSSKEHQPVAAQHLRESGAKQQGGSTGQQHSHVATTLLDLPSHLLAPHLQGLAPQHRLALLQSCRALRDLAVSSAPRLQLGISISQQGQCVHPHAAATAAWAAALHPALHLRLRHTPATSSSTSNSSSDTVLPAALAPGAAAITPALGWTLTSLTLQGLCLNALVPAAVATLCPALQRLSLQDCTVQAPGSTTAGPSSKSPATAVTLQQSALPCALPLQLETASSSAAVTVPAAAVPSGTLYPARLQHLSAIGTYVQHPAQLVLLAHLPSLCSLELQWPQVAMQHLQHLSSQLTGLTVLNNGGHTSAQASGAQAHMLQSLSTLTALRELRITSLISVGRALQQWGRSMPHLTSLQLPDTWLIFDALPLPVPHLQHVSLCSFTAASAAGHTQPQWQVLQLGHAGLVQLRDLPLLPGLVRPLSIDCLLLHLSDKRLLQPAITRVAECSKPGLEVLELQICGEADNTVAQLPFLLEASPLMRALAAGGTLTVWGGITSAVLVALEACGVQHRVAHLKVIGNYLPAASFFEAAPQALRGFGTVTLDMKGFSSYFVGSGDSREDVLQWLSAAGTAWARLVAYLRAVPGHVELAVLSHPDVMQAAAPFMQQALQGAAHVRISNNLEVV